MRAEVLRPFSTAEDTAVDNELPPNSGLLSPPPGPSLPTGPEPRPRAPPPGRTEASVEAGPRAEGSVGLGVVWWEATAGVVWLWYEEKAAARRRRSTSTDMPAKHLEVVVVS